MPALLPGRLRVRLSITPNTVPITKEQVDNLPIPPREHHRGSVVYYSQHIKQDDMRKEEKVCNFIYIFLAVRDIIENTFDCGFQSYVTVEGEGELFFDKNMLADLAELNATLTVNAGEPE